jgi:hypothetical protein
VDLALRLPLQPYIDLDAEETQHGVTVAVCHLDDTVLVNKTTRISLERRGTFS